MTNYFDKNGNYINCENLSLAEIYHRAFALGVESTPIEDKRPTGEWIKVTDCYCWHWECENCHKRPSRTSTGYDDLSNFCPNCGAEMRKEANNDNP